MPKKRMTPELIQKMNEWLKARPKQCSPKGVCGIFSLALNFSDSRRGLVMSLIMDMKTGKTSREPYYFGGDFFSGIKVGFCPFCGNKVPSTKDC